ncbi:MAG: flagellar FliJ family protein [Gemmatimonadetes bacterium]|nr:flagellar FliJ family protein [Gemmatimonadota bacterium]
MFRLAKVLAWKERLLEDARRELLLAQRQLDELEFQAERAVQERRDLPNGATDDVETLAAWARFADSLRGRESRLRTRMESLRPQVEERRETHRALKREVSGLEKLRERQEALARKRRDTRQQELLDDFASRPSVPGPGRTFPSHPPEPRIPDGPEAEREAHFGAMRPVGGRGR